MEVGGGSLEASRPRALYETGKHNCYSIIYTGITGLCVYSTNNKPNTSTHYYNQCITIGIGRFTVPQSLVQQTQSVPSPLETPPPDSLRDTGFQTPTCIYTVEDTACTDMQDVTLYTWQPPPAEQGTVYSITIKLPVHNRITS